MYVIIECTISVPVMVFYLSAFLLGLCLSAMGLGIFITMKIFRIPDITTDGSYTLGAAVTAVLLTQGWPIWAVIPITLIAGAAAGVLTVDKPFLQYP